MTAEENWHGTSGGYRMHGCRLECCRSAHARAQAKRRAERRLLTLRGYTGFTHGASGYKEWGCKCRACTEGVAAERATWAPYRRNRKKQAA